MSIGAISPSSANQPPARATPPVQGTSPAAPGRTSSASGSTTNLTPEALALVSQLKARDTEVRQHEQAHLATAGGLATSGASYTYQRGPNGVDYAIGGEVHIDTSPGRTPQETIERARTIEAAALAPADPSGADRSVAAQAQQMELQARAELATQQVEQAAARLNGSGPGDAAKVRRAYEAPPVAQPKLDIFA
ncbi:putative metalloprotease CJM1_0395 family protein [Duganella vulcania]|uniref:Catalase n=1 Tax=Duganella vulcania TaxID=2692166 RepID=A0A845GSG5_9BURK|nr:putative metalloprotease CJM1_0395 family protein [Duganella vulcania]MYM95617.1 catalase [Duganella vulcania]